MALIKNQLYRQFLDDGIIKFLEIEDIKKALENIEGKHKAEARSLLIALYYTGARPHEILKTHAGDITEEGSYIIIKVAGGVKKSLPRSIYVSKSRPLVAELLIYARSFFPGYIIFNHFRSSYVRTYAGKRGIKEYNDLSAKLRYHVRKWFSFMEKEVTPYFIRHNRFSKLMAAGASLDEVRQTKGSRTMDSIMPYLHLSTFQAKKVAARNR